MALDRLSENKKFIKFSTFPIYFQGETVEPLPHSGQPMESMVGLASLIYDGHAPYGMSRAPSLLVALQHF